MNGRLVLAFVFVVGGGVVAFAGAQPQAALTPSEALESSGHVRVKGTVDAVDRANGTFALTDGTDELTVEMASFPTRVRPANSLLAEGELVERDEALVLAADEVQMGCPSKYEA